MAESVPLSSTAPETQRPWDARLARRLITPLKDSWVTPNHLTTVRLAVGLSAAAALTPGTYGWSNLGAFLLVLSNFLDHADGELARLSGKSSRIGHVYDLASDALVTVMLFVAMGVAVGKSEPLSGTLFGVVPAAQGLFTGVAIATIFLLRMHIEKMAGKAGTRQAMLAGFETEDVLYLLPLVTLCNIESPFLMVASVGAPLFAIWVAIDYRRTLSRYAPVAMHATTSPGTQADRLMGGHLPSFDLAKLSRQFEAQGAFLAVSGFAPSDITERLVRAVADAEPGINRNYIPGHKQGGSVSRHALEQWAPFVGELYRSPALIDWLSQLCGQPLLPTPADDPHAFALYFYTQPGDHIGWHYDTSYYAGRRYTVLLGVIDQSSCELEYQLHTRDRAAQMQTGSLRMQPGDLVFFDGDRLRHRITPSKSGEIRVSLTFEYVTDPHMHPWWRFVSNMKDAVAYFGFRQVFRR
jgi:phosphatidylglycerophosphate synthase/alkylated DNA repair dioxygenase AlkB